MKRVLILTSVVVLLVVPAVWAGSGPGGAQGRPVPAGSGAGTIVDGDAVFTWAGFGMVNFDNAHFTHAAQDDHMFENSWYYRVGGDADESVLPAPDSSDFTGNVATLDWADVDGRGLFSAQLISTVVDGPGGGVAEVTHVLTINSFAPSNGLSLDLDVFAYLDMDLANTASDDEGLLLNDPDLIEESDPTTLFEWAGPAAIEFKVTNTQQPTGSLRSLFMDGLPTDLDGLGLPFGPADMDAAFQWTAALDPGDSASFTRVETLVDKNVPVELMSFEIE